MPELPEVETIRLGLAREVVGRCIERVEVYMRPPRTPALPSLRQAQVLRHAQDERPVRIWQARTVAIHRAEGLRRAEGRTIWGVARRGKYLLMDLGGGESLLMHLGMTGHLALGEPADLPEKHLYLALRLDDGRELRLSDPRGFGEARLVGPAEREDLGRRLGPEPLGAEFTVQHLERELARRTAMVKGLLLNQSVIAGLGNIYADEALWAARVHPARRANTLAREEIAALHGAIVRVLVESIPRGGTTFRDYRDVYGVPGVNRAHLKVYDRAGQPCARCGHPIAGIRVSGRGTWFCPSCQTLE